MTFESALWFVAPIVATMLAIGGGLAKLIKSLVAGYFDNLNEKFLTLGKSLSDHLTKEESHNDKLNDTLTSVKEALVKLQTEKGLMATAADLSKAEKDLREEIMDTRHILRNEMQGCITTLELKIEKKQDKE